MSTRKDGRTARWPTRAAVLALALAASASTAKGARADEPGGLPPSFSAAPPLPERSARRQERLAVLAVYTAVAAAVVGGSYLLRDDFVGRGVATTAAAWGGLGLGATVGWTLSALGGCHEKDCADANDVGGLAGGLLGATAGSLAGYFLTKHEGMSRVYTTAGGMAPFVLVLGVATIVQW